MKSKINRFILFFLMSAVTATVYADTASTTDIASTTATDLQIKINDHTARIKQLEQEIQTYSQAADSANSQAKTLQSTLRSLDVNQKKITKDLTLTEQKIITAGLTITQLGDQIDTTQEAIDANKKAIADSIRNSNAQEHENILAMILGSHNITDFWNDLENMRQVRTQIKAKSDELQILTADMQQKQASLTTQKTQLVSLKQDLSGKKQAIEYTKQTKAVLLAQTKNQEQTYKNLVKDRETQKAQFEKELYDFESQLNITVDTNKYPAPRHNILSWPLDNVFVTQRFGKTVGASRLYTSGSHNGVDFRASIGTRVKNVLDGVVVGTGNTDAYPGCYSFGKWVMIKHDNGLSTIYGHLSVISVSTGQHINTGDLIGYSGNTGYSTGPHLHISVYATQGVRIEKYVNSRGCKQAVIPLADVKAYLDPLAYFPNY